MKNKTTAWQEGYRAYQRGEGVMSNPYAAVSPPLFMLARTEWQGGWNYADDEYHANKPQTQESQP